MVNARRSIRLGGYDYASDGAYFVTICAHERRCVFGHIASDVMMLNEWGRIVEACWLEMPLHFPHVELDAYVIMPNHMHGIVVIMGNVGATHGSPLQPPTARPRGPQSGSLGAIVGQFKSSVTRRIRQTMDPNAVVWQRNYYEHIIRSEASLNDTREYIVYNPARWACDELFI